uniref:Arrestin C-terminal-like domain-containing protein n=1 Tax=Pectinophora gossypiella TaxID=13191 RepID=A0A1E1W996_PECGO
MGIFCEIYINKPEDEIFRPGMVVSGVIRYTVDKESTFSKITVSLKGVGRVEIEKEWRSDREKTYVKTEHYVDIDNVVTKETVTLPIGTYETPFAFVLPINIPHSLRCYKKFLTEYGKCDIIYYVRIKFDSPGWKLAKRCRKEFTVAPKLNLIPVRLPTVPTICGEQKTLTSIFSSRKHIVDIKANIESCFISPGGAIRFNFEVNNNTNIDIKAVKTKLVEIYSFYTSSSGADLVHTDKVKNTDYKTTEIKSGTCESFDIEMKVPQYIFTIESYATIVKREYFVWIEALLPIPHRNALLKIEVQIGDIAGKDTNTDYVDFKIHNDAPPSYWEVMSEES